MMNNLKLARLKRFLGCRVFWITVSSIFAYTCLSVFMPEQALLELVRIMAATTSLIVLIAFSADAWEAATAGEKDPTDSVILGIWLVSFGNFITNFWLLIYRLAQRPEWMLNLLVFGFLSGWIIAIANILHVSAPGVLRRSGAPGSEIPPVRLRAVGIAAAIGLFAALVILASQPDAVWLVERIRPWLR